MESEIIKFINNRFSKNCNWTNGNCLWFAIILQIRFPSLEIYYFPITGHFACGDGKNFYDWNGVYFSKEKPYLFSDILSNDILWYTRLMEDCFF